MRGRGHNIRATFAACITTLAITIAGCAGHRGHAIVDISRGYCKHNQCARARIKPIPIETKATSIFAAGSVEPINAEARQIRLIGERIDTEMYQLLTANQVLTAKYSNCETSQESYQQWMDSFATTLTKSATIRSHLLVSAFDAFRASGMTYTEFDSLLTRLSGDSNDQLARANALIEALSALAREKVQAAPPTSSPPPAADTTATASPDTSAVGAHSAARRAESARNTLQDIIAASKTGETKGSDPPPLMRLRAVVKANPLATLTR